MPEILCQNHSIYFHSHGMLATILMFVCGLFWGRNGDTEMRNSFPPREMGPLTLSGSKQVKLQPELLLNNTFYSRLHPVCNLLILPIDLIWRERANFILCLSGNVSTAHIVVWTTGLLCGGAGPQPVGLRLQSERRERVQHGPVYPATGWGRTCSQRWQDTCESY